MDKNTVFVCPPEQSILDKVSSRTVILRSGNAAAAVNVYWQNVSNTRIERIWIDSDAPVANFDPDSSWSEFPLTLCAEELGEKKVFFDKLSRFQSMNIRFFLPNTPENLVSLQFMASLQLHCGALFSESVSLDSMLGLYCYDHFIRKGAGSIEPFRSIEHDYKQCHAFNKRLELGAPYLADPARYIHVDKDEALYVLDIFGNRIDLRVNLDDRFSLAENAEYQALLARQDEHILQNSDCARCPGWRICLGTFHGHALLFPGCSEFFTEILEGDVKDAHHHS